MHALEFKAQRRRRQAQEIGGNLHAGGRDHLHCSRGEAVEQRREPLAWLAANAPEARVVFRANRQHTLIEAVRRGLGLGILPCLAADGDPSLIRILGASQVFYLVMHPDIRHARRVRAVVDSIELFVTAERRRIAGT